VLGSSIGIVGTGVAAGLALALSVSRLIESYLFGVTSTDPSVYAMVTASVVVVAVLATWQPANAAARVDPAVTLRAE